MANPSCPWASQRKWCLVMNEISAAASGRSPVVPHISVIIATRDRGPAIATAIGSVQASTAIDWELIVVDQSVDDATEAAIQPFVASDHRVRYIRSTTSGLSCGRNIALGLAGAPLVAITDDDCEVAPDWLAGIIETFDTKPDIAFIAGTLAPAPFPPGTGDIPHFCPTARKVVERAWPLTECFGANIAVRRAVLNEVGIFDELLGSGAEFPCLEEQDLCHRVLLAGHRVLIAPELRVVHHGFRTNAQLRTLWERDGRGFGALMAKEVRCGAPRALLEMARFCGRWVGMSVWRLLRMRRPTKLRQASAYVLSSARGFTAAFRQSLNRDRRVFATQSWLRSAAPTPRLPDVASVSAR